MNGTSNSTENEHAESIAKAAKEAFNAAQLLDNASAERERALSLIKAALLASRDEIFAANAKDMTVRLSKCCW